MARGTPRIEPEWQRPRARDGPARHGRRVDQHVQRHERRAEIMPQRWSGNGPELVELGSVEHGKPGQVPVCGMASLGRMESTGGLRRAAPLVMRSTGTSASGGSPTVAAETMPKQHVGRIVEACAKASRSEDEFIRRVRREGFSIDPRLCKGVAKGSVRLAGPGGRIPDHLAQQGRLDGTVQRDRPRRRTCG